VVFILSDPRHIIEGSLEVKLPTIWTDEKQSRAEAERRGRLEERRSDVEKKCTPLWREARFEVTLHYSTLLLQYTPLH